MSSLPTIPPLIRANLLLLIFGVLFVLVGIVIELTSCPQLLAEIRWQGAITTTGRVIVTEWQPEKTENRLKISYGYKDEAGNIYHNTSVLARRLGKLNLEPGARVVVLYRSDDHTDSCLAFERALWDWVIVSVLGVAEVAAGSLLLFQGLKKFRRMKQ